MKCHYASDPKTGKKFLIPGCMTVVHSDDIKDCTCMMDITDFEKEEYNQKIKELRDEIKHLQEENRIYRKLWQKVKKQLRLKKTLM